MYTSVELDFCPTCYERPPVLSDRFCWAEVVVAQDRFYCTTITSKVKCDLVKQTTKTWFWQEFEATIQQKRRYDTFATLAIIRQSEARATATVVLAVETWHTDMIAASILRITAARRCREKRVKCYSKGLTIDPLTSLIFLIRVWNSLVAI